MTKWKPTSKKRKRSRPPSEEPVTREPDEPINWPHGHVRVELTGPEEAECVRVWIHGHVHFLHATTARELANMLGACLDEYNEVATSHGVPRA